VAVGVGSWNEADRVAALRSYGILDTSVDAIFDDFVRLAADACDAPIAVVNLIDAQRQWFAAEIGLGVREMPLDVSICAHAILQPRVFIVPDLTQDERFACNPLVAGEPGLRFYGGALLQSPKGLPLGTLCVLDYAPRPAGLTERQIFTLEALARQVVAQMTLRQAVAEKELLVLEAHHRVKNTLQMVQSLLGLQARSTRHPEAAQQLRDSAARVRTFSKMHEHLYRLGAAVEVNLAEYLDFLVADPNDGLAAMHPGRDVVFEGEAVLWPSAQAASVGLIVIELVTNAQKYGSGTVSVRLSAQPRQITLMVQDEGTSLPADFNPAHSTGLGMRIINGLLHNHGTLALDRSLPQTRFIVTLDADGG
jgi:two-component sensor histidine kinase